jgi:adenylate kinase
MLRAERASGTELGQTVAGYMDAGELVPDEIIIAVVINAVLKPTTGKGYLLDGFPRTLEQARSLDEALEKNGSQVDMVLSLKVPDEPIIERITGRWSCPKCGTVYHVLYKKPKQDMICDHDGEKLTQRKDDTAEVVKQRLAAYHKQTAPLEAYYREKGVLKEVDGTQDIDSVAQNSAEVVRAAMNEG